MINHQSKLNHLLNYYKKPSIKKLNNKVIKNINIQNNCIKNNVNLKVQQGIIS